MVMENIVQAEKRGEFYEFLLIHRILPVMYRKILREKKHFQTCNH
jgi:hypothetical protein